MGGIRPEPQLPGPGRRLCAGWGQCPSGRHALSHETTSFLAGLCGRRHAPHTREGLTTKPGSESPPGPLWELEGAPQQWVLGPTVGATAASAWRSAQCQPGTHTWGC